MSDSNGLNLTRCIHMLRENPELQDYLLNPEISAFRLGYWGRIKRNGKMKEWLFKAAIGCFLYVSLLLVFSFIIIGAFEAIIVSIYSLFSSRLSVWEGLRSISPFANYQTNFGLEFFIFSLIATSVLLFLILIVLNSYYKDLKPKDRVRGYIFPKDAFDIQRLLPLLLMILILLLCASCIGKIYRDLYALYPGSFEVANSIINPSINLDLINWALIGVDNIFQPLFLSIPEDLGIGAPDFRPTTPVFNLVLFLARLLINYKILKWALFGFKNMYATT